MTCSYNNLLLEFSCQILMFSFLADNLKTRTEFLRAILVDFGPDIVAITSHHPLWITKYKLEPKVIVWTVRDNNEIHLLQETRVPIHLFIKKLRFPHTKQNPYFFFHNCNSNEDILNKIFNRLSLLSVICNEITQSATNDHCTRIRPNNTELNASVLGINLAVHTVLLAELQCNSTTAFDGMPFHRK